MLKQLINLSAFFIRAIEQDVMRIEAIIQNHPCMLSERNTQLSISCQWKLRSAPRRSTHKMQSEAKGYSDLHTFHYHDQLDTAEKFLFVPWLRANFEGQSFV